MTFTGISSAITRVVVWLWHHLVWVASACILLLAVVVLGLRYWVLPNADNYRETVAQSFSKAAGQRVTIGQISADWDGLRPRLNLANVVVHDKAGRPALTLQRIDSTLSWLSVVLWRPRFRSVDLYDPALDIRRDRNGVVSVAGMEMGGDSQEGGFSDWVLSQRDIAIHNASIDWTDEMRSAPLLQLRSVGLRLLNRGDRHRFGVKALPPEALAGPLDVRGDLTGKSLKNLADWNGRLYVQLDYADIAAWRTWVPFPFEIDSGRGMLRAWAVLKDKTLREMTADVQLSQVHTRLGKDLPALDVAALNGRLSWKKLPGSMEVSATQLALTVTDSLRLPPVDFQYKASIDGTGAPLSGQFKANAVELAPLVALADHLPWDSAWRARLAAVSPQGRVMDVSAQWQGAWPEPKKYSARARFEGLALNRYGALPGLQGISGYAEASEKGGTMQLKSQAARFDMPELFKEPLEFSNVAAQAQWTRGDKGYDLKLSNVTFSNADLEGYLSGTYHSVPERPGIADFSGGLKRANAQRVARYLPLPVARGARPWLESAFLAGASNDVKFQVKGDLYDFPFDDEKKGTFFVTASVTGGKLHYADGWPDIEGIDGEFAFRGKRMEILARKGAVSGARLAGVRAEIPDLAGARVLTVTGDAEGATPDFLKFIAASPVAGYIDHFTDGMQGEGPGKLQLRLELPLRDLKGTRISGNYQMTGNRLLLDASIPPLEQVNGKLEFTENGVNIPAATAQFSGGPLSISGSTQRDGTIRMNLQGRIQAEALRRAGGPPWLSQLQGATDWTGSVTVRKKTVDLALDSTLQGISSALPAPFAKSASDTVPLRFERRFVSAERDQLVLSVGDAVSARLIRHSDGKRTIIDRGTVRIGGGAAAEPERDGVFVSGNLKSVNLDHWIKFINVAGGGDSGISYTLAGLDIKFGEWEIYDRKFGELTVHATPAGAQTTRYRLIGREIEGIADWSPQGRGRLVAQLQKLTLPAPASPATPAAPRDKAGLSETAQLPALDILAENFQMGVKPLGKLELKATQQDRDWRIEKLTLSHPDGTLRADGVWQSWLSSPRTQMNVQWTVLDASSVLARLGYPGSMRGGIAEIGGTLSWDGGPYQIDYPSLSGKFVFRAAKGQFRQMEPGIGKLLGILSLQSLPRRLSLDFRDVFSRGFAFDEILGEVKVDHGIAATEKFLITGPAATVLMGGSVDLSRETQNLQVKVSPHLSEGVAIATGLLGGPIAALATFVAQKLLKDPFGDLVAYRYSVTGGWADPVVTRIEAPAGAPAPND